MTALLQTPVRTIVRAIADAAERWSDADFPPRVRATERVVARTGYSVPVIEYALDRLFFGITHRELVATIQSELGSLDILDGFAPRGGRPDAWAAPAGAVCIISSRTTIGVAIVPAIFALCAKCDVLVKDREDALVRAFFETLAEELDPLAQAARAASWSSEDERAPNLAEFDGVVAFGDDRTLAAISSAVHPSARYIGCGSRASAGYVTREALSSRNAAAEVARGAARDLVLYETEGCLSLHTLFAERGGEISVADFGSILAAAVEEANVEFPIGERSAAEVAAIAQQRDLAAFRAAGGRGAVFASADADYAIIVDQPSSEPPHFLPRTIGVLAVDGPRDALAYVREHRLRLEGFALSEHRADALEMAVAAGAVRLTRFGELQHPPLSGDHGGRPRIAEFVRWIDRSL
ncbi:MAG TPA: acyl-CoA reductase [Candidatus Baltobacteraceae bacterium]|nr:acyl-CoA reductase [Candidatus Baltobacteraceae bacterium]